MHPTWAGDLFHPDNPICRTDILFLKGLYLMHWQNRSFSFLLAIPQEIVITALSTFLVACNEVSFKIVLFVLRQTWFTMYSK